MPDVARQPAQRYPFVPKSNRYLRPGQFWAIPLSDGRFATGRITAVPAFGPRDSVGIVIGLMDWVGSQEPTADDLVGCSVLIQAKSRFDAISSNGAQVLGMRPLELDGIVAMYPDDHAIGTKVRVWGSRAHLNLAERVFVGHLPLEPTYVWGDKVRVPTASDAMHAGVIVGVTFLPHDTIYRVQFGDGRSVEVPESMVTLSTGD